MAQAEIGPPVPSVFSTVVSRSTRPAPRKWTAPYPLQVPPLDGSVPSPRRSTAWRRHTPVAKRETLIIKPQAGRPDGAGGRGSLGRQTMTAALPPYRAVLAALTGLFAFRVAAQAATRHGPLPILPEFAAWHSEALAYPLLLSVQSVILAVMLLVTMRARLDGARPRAGAFLCALGALYAAAMALRLVVGAAGLSDHRWFDGAIAAGFHFALAAFLIVLGAAWRGPGKPGMAATALSAAARRIAWPLVMAGAITLFVWLRETGAPLLFSAWLAAAIGIVGVLVHETLQPLRPGWWPLRRDLASDGAFLVLVQIALPPLLKVLTLVLIVAIAGTANGGTAPLAAWWPHTAPLAVQVALMLLVAEFFRYWLHRALHVRPLWPLHAVHHAADKLYTVNVGRFHPLDKALQFLGDTLPFLLLGVAPEIFAAYFVVYAVNGFYQHSNADVRLGLLNWFIAGPELHRWHHSSVASESHANFGNNLIVWDTLFGTRFLPHGRVVHSVGIGNRNWPTGFAAQLVAPFTTPTDAAPATTPLAASRR